MPKEAIEGLKPELIWERFYEITRIPRPSKKEEKITQYLRDFAGKHNLDYKEDDSGNIVMKLPATKGYENAPTVVLQGHTDMVCEKNKGTDHDFDNDPIKIKRDGDWIRAEGTTLGADNGIGVAAALYAVTDEGVEHGPLELLFTVDEETGMTGVSSLSNDFLEGRMLLNMDSEEDGVFYVGCSGGQDTVGYFDLETTEPENNFKPYELMVTELKGGHSGLDIHKQRANAIKLLGRLLEKLADIKYQISDITGGSLRNAIPREAEVILWIDPANESRVKKIADEFVEEALKEFKTVDGGLTVNFERKETNVDKVIADEFTDRLVKALLALPHGVMAYSPDIPDLVETSTNLATINIEDGQLRVGTSQRSSIDAAKISVSNSVKAIFELVGASNVDRGSGYPGWQPNMDSQLLKTSKKVYKELFGEEPGVKAIHAGLETGLLGSKYAGMDMISFGPTIENAHSPDERINVKTVEKFYQLMKGILKELAENK